MLLTLMAETQTVKSGIDLHAQLVLALAHLLCEQLSEVMAITLIAMKLVMMVI